MEVCIRLIKMCIKKETEYRTNFILLCFAVTPIRLIQLLFAWIIAKKMNGFNGWMPYDMVFLYSVFMVSYSFAQMFFRHFRFLEEMVVKGTLDTYLLRPQPVLISLIFYNTHIMEIFSQLFPSIIILIISCMKVNVIWDLFKIFVLIQTLIGGSLLQSCIFILIGCLSFFTIKSSWLGEFYYSFRDYMSYPISMFGNKVLQFLTYVFPLAFVSYYPARFILEKEDPNNVKNFLTLPVGIFITIITIIIWRLSLKKYTSTGN